MDPTQNEFLFIYSNLSEVEYTVTHKFTDTPAKGEELSAFEKIFGKGNNTLHLTFTYKISGESITKQAAYVEVSFREGITKEQIVQAAIKQYGSSSIDSNALWSAITKMSPNFFIQDLILTKDSKSPC
jgi:hypothetical protein